MAKLILSLDGTVLQEYSLDTPRLTIGRKAHNDIPIDNLAVSSEHASISTVGNDSILEDLGSTNGTLVNGQNVKKHLLQDNDLIEVGKYKLKYMSERIMVKAKSEEENDFDKTMIIRPVSSKAQPKAADTQGPTTVGLSVSSAAKPAVEAPAQDVSKTPAGFNAESTQVSASLPGQSSAPQERVAVVQLLNGANAGKELALTKSITSLGKPGVQVAVIAKRPQGYFITHVQGDHFPVLNGKQLESQAHQLNDHDVIELAGIKMEFYFK